MDDEQKKLAQARIDKQMNEGFEKIFFPKDVGNLQRRRTEASRADG